MIPTASTISPRYGSRSRMRSISSSKMVPEVCRIFRATVNPTEMVVASDEELAGIRGHECEVSR